MCVSVGVCVRVCVCVWGGGSRQTLGMEGWKETLFYWMSYRAQRSEADSAGDGSVEYSIIHNAVLEHGVLSSSF